MNLNQLLPLLAIVAFIVVLASIVRLFASRGGRPFPYERIERLFTPAERSFLGVLEDIFGNEYAILGKIRLGDIIRPRTGLSNSDRTSAQNRIAGKHVDFALCDLGTRAVIGVIELDDSSHQRASRQRRDQFVDGALAAAGVPVAHITVQKAYNRAEVRAEVLAAFAQSANPPRPS
jgi:very-short-patch-repair endonuclease